MSIRSNIAVGLLALYLAIGVNAEAPRRGDHLSYYTYYKTKSGETVSVVAGKFGLAESSLRKMNPQLLEEESALPPGSLLCVPASAESKDELAALVKSKKKPKAMEAKAEKPKAKAPLKQNKKESEEPDDDEWDKLAELATGDAPKIASTMSLVPTAPPSKLIRSNGEIVWIPAAKPKAQPKPKVEASRGRVELTSRKGKAIHDVLKTCRSYMGTPYVWGGELPGGFDCSGYVQYVFARHGYRLPRTADIQYNVGDVVKRGEEKPGDLVFFETYAPGASHVGVFLGRGYFIHASSSRGVTVDRLATDFFAQRYLGAKRNSF